MISKHYKICTQSFILSIATRYTKIFLQRPIKKLIYKNKKITTNFWELLYLFTCINSMELFPKLLLFCLVHLISFAILCNSFPKLVTRRTDTLNLHFSVTIDCVWFLIRGFPLYTYSMYHPLIWWNICTQVRNPS